MTWKRMAALCIGVACFAASVHGGDWAQFRGPNNSGVALESQAPSEWSITKNLAWKMKIPGYGWSSPIVVGDKIIVTTAVSEKQRRPQPFTYPGGGGFGPPGGPRGGAFKDKGGDRAKGPPGGFRGGPGGPGMFGNANPPDAVYRWEIHCLDRYTGKTLWSHAPLERKPAIAATMGNGYASETPVSDGARVYAYFGMHGLYCYDLSGKELWRQDLGSYKMMMSWGTGSSPALDGERLFVLCDNEEKSFLAAFDKTTGKELWRVTRADKSSWSTPFVWRNQVRTEIVTAGGKSVRAYDPADGKVLWEIQREGGGMGPPANATPVADETMLYVGAGSPFGASPLWAIKAGASGDISLKPGETSNAGIAWSSTRGGPPMASPLLYQDHLYILMQNGGMLNCYDAKTGREIYRQRLKGAKSFTSSPWLQDGKLYCLDESGQTFVVQAGPKFELLGKNETNDMFWSTPAVARDALYLRGVDWLYCFRQ